MIHWSVSTLKRLFAVFIPFLCILPLDAAFYKSNALMMRLEDQEGLVYSGYELEIKDGLSILYLDGKEVLRLVEDGSSASVYQGDELVEERRYDEEGRLVYFFDSGTEIRYYYDGSGILSSATFSNADGLGVNEYVHSPLGAITRIDSCDGGIYLFPSSELFSFGLADDVRVFDKNEENEDEEEAVAFTSLPDGGIEASRKDGVVNIYDAQGRLSSRRDGDVLFSYAYDEDGNLSSVLEEYPDRSIKETYVDDALSSRITSYPDGRSVEERFEDKGKVEIRSRNSVPYVKIVYDLDMKTVKEVERL